MRLFPAEDANWFSIIFLPFDGLTDEELNAIAPPAFLTYDLGLTSRLNRTVQITVSPNPSVSITS